MSSMTPDILKALRMIRDGSAPPPASERLMVPSWAVQAMNDLVPDSTWRLTAAGAAVVALADELDELRLTLAAEQGKPEGAPSEGWIFGEDCYRKRRWSKGLSECIYGRDGWKWRKGRRRFRGAPSARAAMIAADKATP